MDQIRIDQASFFYGKKVLVLGGSGFIGSNLVPTLVSYGAKVTATYLNRKPQDLTSIAEIVQIDATCLKQLSSIIEGHQLVFIASAITSGSAIMRNTPFVHLSDNMVMNTRILEACELAKVKRVLFISSSTVYPNSPSVMTEENQTGDFFPAYEIVATMKQASERLMILYSKHSKNLMETVIVRPSNCYGPKDDFNLETSKVLPALISKFSHKKLPVEVWGDGMDIKDFIYIDDLIDGIIKTMAFGRNGSIYNIGSGEDSTIREAVGILAENFSIPLSAVNYLVEVPSMIPIRRISIQKARKQLQFVPKIKLKEGLIRTANWFENEKSKK